MGLRYRRSTKGSGIVARVLLLTLDKRQKNFQVGPPLGLLYLGAILQRAGHRARLLDLRARGEKIEQHLEEVIQYDPQYIGISAVISDADVLGPTVEVLKTQTPMARIVVGGPYPHSSILDVLRVPGIDAAVRGEGDEVLPKLLAAWERDEQHPELPGVGYPGVTIGNEPEPVKDLDALPLPAWELIDFALYHNRPRHGYLYKHREYFSVSSSRGCPYRCAFCQNTFGRNYRTRRPAAVVDEIEKLVRDNQIKEIHFVDDAFNLDLARAKQICDLLIDRRLELALTFPAGLRADRMDRELIDKLAKAGCYKIPYGIETASPRLQKVVDKNVNLARLTQVIEATERAGIISQGFFILGFPDETEAEAQETVNFALKSKLTFITFNHLNVLPGTALWDIASARGLTQDYDPGRIDYDNPPIHLAAASRKTLKKLTRKVHLRFYLNPRRLWRIWRRLPHKKHFFGFLGLFFGKLFWFTIKE